MKLIYKSKMYCVPSKEVWLSGCMYGSKLYMAEIKKCDKDVFGLSSQVALV